MTLTRKALVERAKSVRLLAMDVDGVLTGGEIVVLESGEEVKFWNAKDRLVLALIRDHGQPLKVAWITGRSSEAVTRAAADLGVPHVVQGCQNKEAALQALLKKNNLSFNQAAFIGDDLIDLPSLQQVGFAACPADASSDVKRHVHYVSPVCGGRGVARDIIEFILKAQKRWDAVLKNYLS